MRLALHWQILLGMVLGAVIGITVNRQATEKVTELTGEDAPGGYERVKFTDSLDRIEMELQPTGKPAKSLVVDGTGSVDGAYPTLKELSNDHKAEFQLFQQYGRSSARWVGDTANRIGGLFLCGSGAHPGGAITGAPGRNAARVFLK